MPEFEIVDGNNLDYIAFAELQREAFAQRMKSMKISFDFITPKFYKWKFYTPAGYARIAFVQEKKRILSATAMVPYHLRFGHKRVRGWQSCDYATIPEARRKGYIVKGTKALMESIDSDEVMYSFPNSASTKNKTKSAWKSHTIQIFRKTGWEDKGVVPTWVKLLVIPRRWESSDVRTIAEFDESVNQLAEKLTTVKKVMVERSKEYLNWRYTNHPVCHYTSFVFNNNGGPKGFAVVRSVSAMDEKIAVIMELWGFDLPVLKALCRTVARWASEQKIRKIVFQDNGISIFQGLQIGFIRAPNFLLPKEQMHVGYEKSGSGSQAILEKDWRLQMGDWDGL